MLCPTSRISLLSNPPTPPSRLFHGTECEKAKEEVPPLSRRASILRCFFRCRGIRWYCWWKKSCTTWDGLNPINNGMIIILGGAGFCPSTVWFNLPVAHLTSTTRDWVDMHRDGVHCCYCHLGVEPLQLDSHMAKQWEGFTEVKQALSMLQCLWRSFQKCIYCISIFYDWKL